MESLNGFVAVRAALAQRAADAKFLTKGRPNRGGAWDDDAMSGVAPGDNAAPAVFHLTYVDSKGEVSQRVVTIRRIEPREDHFRLHCLCHLRGAPRVFATDRIEEVYDGLTGEVHGDATRFFGQHPLFMDPREPEQVAIATCRDEINILTVVGAADGLFDPDEQDRLLVHVYDRCDHLRLDEALIRRMLALITPDEVVFHGSLERLRRFRAGDARKLLSSLRKLVDADGHLHPSEVAFVTQIECELARTAERTDRGGGWRPG